MRNLLICSALVCTAVPFVDAPQALGAAEVRLDSSGFLKQATDRAAQASMISARGAFATETPKVSAELDLKLLTYLHPTDSFTLESRNFYLATSPALLGKHQLSLGRRDYDWALIDREWNLGYVSPRFTWDPLHPEQVGLTGLFYSWKHRDWQVLALVSPLAVPERGVPVQQQDGKLVSADPLHQEPVDEIQVVKTKSAIRYRIDLPPARELIFNPGAAVSARFRPERGFGGALTYAALPMNQADMTMETGVRNDVEATIRPRILRRQLAIAEATYQDDDIRHYVTASYELPEPKTTSENHVARSYGRTFLGSVGGELYRRSRVQFGWSYLTLREQKTDSVDASLLPKRFWFTHAVRTRFRWTPNPKLVAEAKWTRDLRAEEDLFSADMAIRPAMKSLGQPDQGWIIGFGLDMISTPTGLGSIGQFEGDDRVRGRVSYAF